MRNLLSKIPAIAFLGGMAAALLRLWMLLGGVDENGLYPKFHIAWLLIWLLAAAMILLFWRVSKLADEPYDAILTPTLGAAGHLLATWGIAYTNLMALLDQPGPWELALCSLGLASAFLIGFGGILRLKGKQQHFLTHALSTLYFALRVFFMGKTLGAEPEMSRFLLQFMASLSMLLACYQLWGFDVGSGSRQKRMFWSLTAAFLCMAAVPGAKEVALYAGVSQWLLFDMGALQPEKPAEEAEECEDIPEIEAIEAIEEAPDSPEL